MSAGAGPCAQALFRHGWADYDGTSSPSAARASFMARPRLIPKFRKSLFPVQLEKANLTLVPLSQLSASCPRPIGACPNFTACDDTYPSLMICQMAPPSLSTAQLELPASASRGARVTQDEAVLSRILKMGQATALPAPDQADPTPFQAFRLRNGVRGPGWGYI